MENNKQQLNDSVKAKLLFSLTDAFLLAKREIIQDLDKMRLETKLQANLGELNQYEIANSIYKIWKRALRGAYANARTNQTNKN